MTEANFGWLIRSVDRWSESMMVLMMILHVFRLYLTGGFKKPRVPSVGKNILSFDTAFYY